MFDRKAYMKQYHKKWYIANKQKIDAQNKAYATSHVEKIRQYKTEWYRANKPRLLSKGKAKHLQSKEDGSRLKYNLKKLYGITVNQYEALKSEQNGKCAICRLVPTERLHVDHSHSSGKVRGLLCRRCNFGIGLLREDFTIFTSAIRYLSEAA